MLLDKENLFSDAQAVTTGSENGIASTNVIDFGSARNIGVGENLYIVVSLDATMSDSGNNSTLTVYAQSDDNESFNTATNTQTIGTFAVNSVIGSRLVARVQPGTFNEKYGRLFYLSANGALTTGSLSAALAKDVELYTAYPDAVTIAP